MTPRHETITTDRLLHESRLASLALHLVAGETGLSRQVTNPRLQKPGLALAGARQAPPGAFDRRAGHGQHAAGAGPAAF